FHVSDLGSYPEHGARAEWPGGCRCVTTPRHRQPTVGAIAPGRGNASPGCYQGNRQGPAFDADDHDTAELDIGSDGPSPDQDRLRDPGTLPLPQPMHGEIQATFSIERNPNGPGGRAVLEVKVPDEDSKIVFKPATGTGLTSAHAAEIAHLIRHLMRTKLDPIN